MSNWDFEWSGKEFLGVPFLHVQIQMSGRKVATSEKGCLKDVFTRRKKFLVSANSTSKFFVWDSQFEGKGPLSKGETTHSVTRLREIKTNPSRMLGSRWVVSSSVHAVSAGYKIHYVNIQTGKDIKTYTLPSMAAGFVFLDEHMYVLTLEGIFRFNRDLDQVPTTTTGEYGTELLVPEVSVAEMYGQISITSVGDKIFTRGSEEGILWDRSLKVLKRFK